MKVVARRRAGFAHDVEIEGGHTIRVDEPADTGGADTGLPPLGSSPQASPAASR